MSLSDWILGKPLATREAEENKATVWTGIPMLGLDALSSAAYGPEAALTILLPLGAMGLTYAAPILGIIVALLTVLYFSYRQTIHAYPSGGGSYTVASANLGSTAGLFAAAALMIDYVLTVAVGISAGVGALVSAVPQLHSQILPLCLAILALVTVVNLRGVRESGSAFLLPTYLFVLTMLAVIAMGVYKSLAAGGHPVPMELPPALPLSAAAVSPWLLLRSFASGCTAMTGVEAVSNGIQAFKEPRLVRAQQTLTAIVVILAILLLGIAYLCKAYNLGAVDPDSSKYQSIISQLVAAVAGRGTFYYVTLFSVIAVLALSANTGFADFPRLCEKLAADEYLPHFFATRGRRLVYSSGIMILAALCAILLAVFGGITDRLIPLFAVGAFLAFTLSQAGMVAHWRRKRGKGWKISLAVNGLGALSTACALVVILFAKLLEGAWIVVVLIPAFVTLFAMIRRHYVWVNRRIAHPRPIRTIDTREPLVILPVKGWNIISEAAVQFALSISKEVFAIHVTQEEEHGESIKREWHRRVEEPLVKAGKPRVALDVIHSPYRRLTMPILAEVCKLRDQYPDRTIAVIIPELVEQKWYQYPLHNQRANFLKAVLLFRAGRNVVVINVPWYLTERGGGPDCD